jgi:NAD(P)-dependent dehydrogenase (short-subunit alcohol dehydrogenase family)
MAEIRGRLTGRVALVTGASHGIGRAVALRYAGEGAALVLVGRTQGALEEVDDEVRKLGGQASLVPADLTDFAVIDRMGAAVYERWRRLDVLVGNAGVLGVLSPLGHMDPKTWDQVIAVNLTANWRLIRSFDPLLRASDAGRAIFVTSGVAQGRAYWGGYAVSKGALETLARTYAHECANTKVRVNLINPGPTRTRMRAAAYPGEDPRRRKPADDPALLEAFLSLAEPACDKNGELITV